MVWKKKSLYTQWRSWEVVKTGAGEENTRCFSFGHNHNFDEEPNYRELTEWGDRLFQLALTVLGPDRQRALEVTIKSLNLWAGQIRKEKQRAGRATRLYRSNPTKILKNRYHLLQEVVFDNLQEEEMEDETAAVRGE